MRLSPPTLTQMSQYFLRLDGQNEMRGNIVFKSEAGKNYGIKIQRYIDPVTTYGVWLRMGTAWPDTLLIRNPGDTDYASLALGIIRWGMMAGFLRDSVFQTASATGDNTMLFRQYEAAWFNIMKMLTGRLDIYRLGDVTLLSTRILNAIEGALRLPNTRPAGPSAGDCRYDPATDTFEIYDGAAWHSH